MLNFSEPKLYGNVNLSRSLKNCTIVSSSKPVTFDGITVFSIVGSIEERGFSNFLDFFFSYWLKV